VCARMWEGVRVKKMVVERVHEGLRGRERKIKRGVERGEM
jgi:hypothetical protein